MVDTSIWADHFRRTEIRLVQVLNRKEALMHPFVLGELAMGTLRPRDEKLAALRRLPRASLARDEEVLRFVDAHALYGRGIGYVDAHLLASALLTPGTTVWTRDRRMLAAATKLGLT